METDFIITVTSNGNTSGATTAATYFETFTISKSYSAFRTLAQLLKQAADACERKHRSSGEKDLPPPVAKLTKYCHTVFQLIDAQPPSYLGKVNYIYVKILAKQRKEIIDGVLSATCLNFPIETRSHSLLYQVASIVETFLLTDHVVLDHDEDASHRGDEVKGASLQPHNERKLSLESALDNINPLAWINTGVKAVTQRAPKANSFSLSVDTASTTKTGVSATTAGGTPVVIPITRRSRRSYAQRDQDEEELCDVGKEAMLLVDDDRPTTALLRLPNYSKPVPTVRTGSTGRLGRSIEAYAPWTFLVIAVVAAAALQKAADCTVSMDGDLFLLCIFASFCLGLHTPRCPMIGGYDRTPTMKGTIVATAATNRADRSGRKLLRRSMIVTSPMAAAAAARQSIALANTAGLVSERQQASIAMPTAVVHEETTDEGEEDDDNGGGGVMDSPMAMFPAGAEIGSHLNCWSRPDTKEFHVRGPNYLSDQKKVPSGDYLFPCRGVDLFLTDACPQNVGRNAGVMGGRLRDVPTFIVNFRLPWGVLLLYCEIPPKFVPFVEASTAGDVAVAKLLPLLEKMTPPERTAARWLLNDSVHKNKTLKIVPVVVDGPWVVKSVVGGKPAIIGAKLPITYVYQPAGENKALYLEADLDIVASSAARGILSITRSYTQVLTINLGFVIQGNQADELPEQMLTGARLHGIDPLTAPSLPLMDNEDDFNYLARATSDDESV